MSGWIEVMITGNCRAFLDASHIKGVLSPSGLSPEALATADNTITLVMGSGETLPGVYGISVTRLLFRLWAIAEHLRHYARRHAVVYLDNGDQFDAEMASIMAGARNAETG